MNRIRPDLLRPAPEPLIVHDLPTQPRCCKKFCPNPATHQMLIVAEPGEETFTFDGFQVCTPHIPKTLEEVFPTTEGHAAFDNFKSIYPATTGFHLQASPMASSYQTLAP